jgi:outer membrane protein insertion porin family
LRGTQFTASFALAGLGGDVRTYQPNVSFTKFMPVRRKKSKNPEVFAFRIQAGTIGSFALTDTVKNANSIAFIGGVPAYERYFLGSENDVRGYESRSIGPVAPFDTYVTSRNVIVSAAPGGINPPPQGGFENPQIPTELASLGLVTGPDGANPALYANNFRFIGGDSMVLGNFEYRIPIFGPATLAVFADVGSVFNLRKDRDTKDKHRVSSRHASFGRGPADVARIDECSCAGKQFWQHPLLPRACAYENGFRERILSRQPVRLPDVTFP